MGDASRTALLKTVGAYALMEKFSDGYLGPVYKSFDKEMDRAVEIRVFCDGIQWDDDLKSQMKRECAPLMHLDHPHIASLIALHTEGQIPFMVLDPVGKRNLRSFLERKRDISFESKMSIMMQVARGVAFAHGKGIVHQDICPENIFVRADGSVKVRDFAIAHLMKKHLPHPGVRYGAPIYLSPEQIQHQEAGARSDIFASGVVFCELLTGSHPFFDPDSNRMLDNFLNHRPCFTPEQYPHYHPRIWHILKRCLAKKQEDRYRDAGEMLAALQSMFREMSEDVHLMLSELQASFASLKGASEHPDASKAIHRLSRSVWNILRGAEQPGYERLDALMTDLSEAYPEIQARAVEKGGSEELLQPHIRPEDLHAMPDPADAAQEKAKEAAWHPSRAGENSEKGTPDTSLEALSPVPDGHQEEALQHDALPREKGKDSLAGEGPGAATMGTASGVEPQPRALPEAEGEGRRLNATSFLRSRQKRDLRTECRENRTTSSGDSATTSSFASRERHAPKKPSGKRGTFRVSKRSFRLFAVLVLILLAVAAVHVLKGEGDGDTVFGSLTNRAWNSWTVVKASVLKDPPAENSGPDANEQVSFAADSSDTAFESHLMDSLEVGYTDDALAHSRDEKLNQVRNLMRRGELKRAQAELDRIRRAYHDSPEVLELYDENRRLMSASANGKAIEAQVPLQQAALADGGHQGQRREIPEHSSVVEEGYRFAAEHGHGLLRGHCSGELLLGHSELQYRTPSGDHDFSVPVKILKLKREGRSVQFLFLSSSELFKELDLASAEEALRFTQTWDSLISPSRN